MCKLWLKRWTVWSKSMVIKNRYAEAILSGLSNIFLWVGGICPRKLQRWWSASKICINSSWNAHICVQPMYTYVATAQDIRLQPLRTKYTRKHTYAFKIFHLVFASSFQCCFACSDPKAIYYKNEQERALPLHSTSARTRTSIAFSFKFL